jgi:hypothetical protein
MLTGVCGAIDLLVCQGKEDFRIGRADEQLLDGLILQTGFARLPRVSFVVRSQNAVSLGAQVKDG